MSKSDFVKRFHGEAAAENAVQEFERIFVDRGLPDDMPEYCIPATHFNEDVDVAALLKDCGLVQSTSEARRLIQSRAVEIAGEKVMEPRQKFMLKSGDQLIVKVGKKKFAKLLIG
jgi:tyrosyl-tRNA synthetase